MHSYITMGGKKHTGALEYIQGTIGPREELLEYKRFWVFIRDTWFCCTWGELPERMYCGILQDWRQSFGYLDNGYAIKAQLLRPDCRDRDTDRDRSRVVVYLDRQEEIFM